MCVLTKAMYVLTSLATSTKSIPLCNAQCEYYMEKMVKVQK